MIHRPTMPLCLNMTHCHYDTKPPCANTVETPTMKTTQTTANNSCMPKKLTPVAAPMRKPEQPREIVHCGDCLQPQCLTSPCTCPLQFVDDQNDRQNFKYLLHVSLYATDTQKMANKPTNSSSQLINRKPTCAPFCLSVRFWRWQPFGSPSRFFKNARHRHSTCWQLGLLKNWKTNQTRFQNRRGGNHESNEKNGSGWYLQGRIPNKEPLSHYQQKILLSTPQCGFFFFSHSFVNQRTIVCSVCSWDWHIPRKKNPFRCVHITNPVKSTTGLVAVVFGEFLGTHQEMVVDMVQNACQLAQPAADALVKLWICKVEKYILVQTNLANTFKNHMVFT